MSSEKSEWMKGKGRMVREIKWKVSGKRRIKDKMLYITFN